MLKYLELQPEKCFCLISIWIKAFPFLNFSFGIRQMLMVFVILRKTKSESLVT